MATEAQTLPKPGQAPKRRLRNYLLDPRFQLKYTGMVVAVTVLVTGAVGTWLGREAYMHSTGMTQMLAMDDMDDAARDELLTEEARVLIEAEAEKADQEVLRNIVTGIVLLVLVLSIALGFTGIIVTHKVVGPAYKLRLLLGDVERGKLNVRGGFRKGDELQELGDAFKHMVVALRARREEEVAQLDAAIEKAREANVEADVIAALTGVRDRWREPLDKS
jgi:methyl-accepting chemotaxis protein